jgi:hypothetical protein
MIKTFSWEPPTGEKTAALWDTNTNPLNILTPPFVIANPKGVAISYFMGLFCRFAPRNDNPFGGCINKVDFFIVFSFAVLTPLLTQITMKR